METRKSHCNHLRGSRRHIQHKALSFAASGLSMRAGYAPSAATHSFGYAFCLHARPGITCPAPYIRNPMKIRVKPCLQS